jgi:hypothetical protein
MVKSFISMLIVALLILAGSLWECFFIKNQFEDFNKSIQIVYEKVDEHTATMDDIYALQKNWLNKKKTFHMLIPHNEIKEVDLWLSETATLVRDKQWEDAISKVEVLLKLSEQIPKTFTLSPSNIF